MTLTQLPASKLHVDLTKISLAYVSTRSDYSHRNHYMLNLVIDGHFFQHECNSPSESEQDLNFILRGGTK